jgi:hypothetical protein
LSTYTLEPWDIIVSTVVINSSSTSFLVQPLYFIDLFQEAYTYLEPEEYYVAGDGVDIHEHVLHHDVDVRTLA